MRTDFKEFTILLFYLFNRISQVVIKILFKFWSGDILHVVINLIIVIFHYFHTLCLSLLFFIFWLLLLDSHNKANFKINLHEFLQLFFSLFIDN